MSALNAAIGVFKPELPYYFVKNATERIDVAMFRASPEAQEDLKQKVKNEPIGKIKIVDDFLPKPKDLVLKEETKNIAIYLKKIKK